MIGWIADRIIESRVKAAKGQAKEFMAWSDVRSVCLIATKDNSFNAQVIDAFIKQSGKTTETLVFVPTGDAPVTGAYQGFTKKQLNFFSLPKPGVAGQVEGRSYDLLIDCNFNAYPSMKLLSGSIKAKFKVGLKGLPYDNYFDICIDLKNDVNQKNYLEQVMNYLKMIKTKN